MSFFSFEGGEGSGKTTVLNLLKTSLTARGYSVLVTREPGGTAIAEQIRQVLLGGGSQGMDPRTEALLYAASRRQHLVEIIQPALAKGQLVLSDRYVDSSLVYQGVARNIGVDEVKSLNEFAIEGTWPDLTFFLDLPPEEGIRRIRANGDREWNRFDAELIDFHETVRSGYRALAHTYKERMVTVNANDTPEMIAATIEHEIVSHLNKTPRLR